MAKQPELYGPARYRVRYRERPAARLQSVVTLAGQPPRVIRGHTLGDLMAYRKQADGGHEVLSLGMVQDVLVERQDRYEQWHQVGTWSWD